ncbi:MAG TPA: DNA polymerase III subunit beta [Gaiellaceae bacterium]|nr:DNA polymerase III subunit beta [Gaiellaceae bacterium]
MNQVESVIGAGLKIICERDELAQKLAVVSRGVSTRTAVQILGGILLRAAGGRVELASTDMELSLRTTLEARVDGEGSVVVPGRLLVDLSRLLPGSEVSLEHREEENVLHVRCGAAEYRLNTFGAEDFPRLPDPELAQTSTVDADVLLETLASVGRAVSRDEARPVLTGILVRFGDGKLVMAATDSYRLAYRETAVEGPVPDLEAIVPARALEELRRLATGGGSLELGVQENQVVFGVDGTWLTTRRIEGQFPKFDELRPKEFKHEVTLPREELLDVVRRTAVMAHRNSPLRLRFAEGEVTVWTQTQDVGEARESLPLRFEGEPLEIGFNADFLRDGIESASGDELRLRLIDPLRPGLIQGPADDFWYLIMPIRLAG